MNQELSPYRHIVKSQQFTIEFLEEVFKLADYMKSHEYSVSRELKNKIVALIFYETSTRTRMSFEAAALRLGATKIHTENAQEFSSVAKGETLRDTIKTVSCYSDFIVLRHFENDSSSTATRHSSVPIINAGSGDDQHPTQALLDVYTILDEFRRLHSLRFAVVGDLLRGRTANSLVYLMCKYPGTHFCFVSPPNSRIKPDLRNYLTRKQISFEETDDLEKALKQSDVVYMTRIQEERFTGRQEFLKAKSRFILNADMMRDVKSPGLIMHPFPRVDEIPVGVDTDPRSGYFRQLQNGLYIRMALLKMLNDRAKQH